MKETHITNNENHSNLQSNVPFEELPEWFINAKTKDAVIEFDKYLLIWKSGTWKKGTWENGKWERGIWKRGIYKDGYWEDGIIIKNKLTFKKFLNNCKEWLKMKLLKQG